jgi:hypothetical protein
MQRKGDEVHQRSTLDNSANIWQQLVVKKLSIYFLPEGFN